MDDAGRFSELVYQTFFFSVYICAVLVPHRVRVDPVLLFPGCTVDGVVRVSDVRHIVDAVEVGTTRLIEQTSTDAAHDVKAALGGVSEGEAGGDDTTTRGEKSCAAHTRGTQSDRGVSTQLHCPRSVPPSPRTPIAPFFSIALCPVSLVRLVSSVFPRRVCAVVCAALSRPDTACRAPQRSAATSCFQLAASGRRSGSQSTDQSKTSAEMAREKKSEGAHTHPFLNKVRYRSLPF